MLLSDSEATKLKDWIISKLGDVPDAEPDILADYALALIKGDGDLATIRANCIENLKDFLFEGTEAFVDQVLQALQSKAYDPSYKPPPKAQSQSQSRLQAPSGPRKRTFDQRGDDDEVMGNTGAGQRQIKQMRRGGRGRDGRGGGRQGNWDQQSGAMPQFNAQDAFNALMAMQQAMGLPTLPGMEQFGGQGRQRKRGRCRDYDNKGFCTRGEACPYEHGNEALVVGQNGSYEESFSGRGRGQNGRGRGRGGARGGRRAEFSSAAPNHDKSITAIVVEQIPEDKLDEQSVRDFFGEFGNISKIDVQAQRKLAIITYETYEEANAAYTSPKVIFDNRFVKVFWYKPDGNTNGSHQHGNGDVEMDNAEPEIDHEEVARRQEEAQRKHEETKKRQEEAAKQKSDIDAKLKAMEAERQKMADLLAKRAGKTTDDATMTGDENESEQTKGLKAQLAKLEAEAKTLGIDPAVASNGNGYQAQSWRGRGGFRGRAGFAPRGRGFRGAWAGTGRGGAVKRLDNRPRTLAITFPSGTFSEHDEAMRQYLLFSDNLDHATLSAHPERTDAAMLVFGERYRAENFMNAARGPSGIPHIGAVEISWMANPAATTPVNGSANDPALSSAMDTSAQQTNVDMDGAYDVAEDDHWN